MRTKRRRGIAYIEFAFSSLVLIPLLLGVISIGLNMHLQLQTVQLARDAGHMYAKGIDFNLTGNQQVLASIGGSLGLSTTLGQGNAVVILSLVRYVDSSACQAAGLWNSSSNTPNGCTNYQKWVFSQRIVIGNNTLRTSNLGTPAAAIIQSNGTITITNQCTNTSDVATVAGINPWNSVTSTGLPSGQSVYVAEASAKGFHMPPFSSGTNTYASEYF